MDRGFWYGFSAYVIWGTFPLYWRLLAHVPALQVLGQRIIWSFLLLATVLLLWRRQRDALFGALTPRVAAIYTAAAALIAVNWYLFIYGVSIGRIVETSLGYFITPLVNVLFGVLVFGERLRRLQWAAVALAATGVIYLTRAYGELPWIALGLAMSFGGYGLVKKKAPLASLPGLTLETAILLLPAAAYLLVVHRSGAGVFGGSLTTDLLLAGGGIITTFPLLLFAAAAQRVPMTVIAILQYIAPTMAFLLGVFVVGEPFTATQLAGFSFVWAAVLVFTVDTLLARRVAYAVLDEGAV